MTRLEKYEGYVAVDSLNGCEGCAFNDVNLIDECLAARCGGSRSRKRSDGRDVIFVQEFNQQKSSTSSITTDWKLQQILNNLQNNWYKNQQEIVQMVKEVISK